MERLYSVQDIMERYQVTAQTARKYMRKMVHMEKPLMVSEASLRSYESGRTVEPGQKNRKSIQTRPRIANQVRKKEKAVHKAGRYGPHIFERRRA